jgi:hypothetical protein
MKTRTTPCRVAGAAAAVIGALVALAVLSPEMASAYTDTIYKYTTPKTGFLHLPAAAFAPSGPNNAFNNNGIEIINGVNGTACFLAPVNLPNGATIGSVAAWYNHAAASNFGLEFIRYKVIDGTLTDLLNKVLPTTGGSRKQAGYNITPAEVVNNNAYAYVMVLCMNAATDSFYGMRIKYTYSNAGD